MSRLSLSRRRRHRGAMPGLGLTLGLSLAWLGLIVLLPLAAILWRSVSLGPGHFLAIGFSARALAAYRLSFGAALAAAGINCGIGLLIAWVLVRYEFPGKRLAGAMVDLPFALPTAVAGIALTALYARNGWIGAPLARLGLPVAYTPAGVVLALIFVGLPFIVRTVEPVLADLGHDIEEAAATLGAGRSAIFLRVLLPEIAPALITGFALAFARGVGEYGSVIFIAGNMPYHTEIAPLLIVTQLEQYDYAGATAIAAVLLATSFVLLTGINILQGRERRRLGQG
ncbi:sulfate ABC transporter permease subunit CysT [Sphingomonas morindae]|uniref:Sulfate transport system permease protein CysT n=1 Tax=Sphingomonas morindae TaxID=1541170 RepID=A0ABY4XC58_9SPHN|nr:sulfate ABC transporter permease subunit CysT [Sphingomonas morindae]USI74255.1 sulfate ABC transporter permease subunit CysT [Sphingomonas morindae]